MEVILYLDTILVPLSLFLTVGYHAFLWHSFKTKPKLTTFGMNILKRRTWLQEFHQGDDKKGMMAVQSFRNTKMETIFTATVSVILTISLAALANNTYNSSNILNDATKFIGSQSSGIVVLKFGLATLFLAVSFLCSSMALGFFVDANFLINATAADDDGGGGDVMAVIVVPVEYTQKILERGFVLAVVGNRVFVMTLPVLLWMMFGPIPVVFSSIALVWVLYGLDFVGENFAIKL